VSDKNDVRELTYTDDKKRIGYSNLSMHKAVYSTRRLHIFRQHYTRHTNVFDTPSLTTQPEAFQDIKPK